MYRIELGPDDIGVFRSIEEMATAIKTGVLTPKARIFHSASDKWLPIEFHPHYKKAREMAAGGVPPAPAPNPVPVRVHLEPPVTRTPIPVPAPIAGLPLIDISTPSTPPEPEPVAPSYPAPVLAVSEPEPEPEPEQASQPEPVAIAEPEPAAVAVLATISEESVTASTAQVQPEPEPEYEAEPEPEEYPAMPMPLAPRPAPVPAMVVASAPAYPDFEEGPEPAAPAVVPPLPEPDREALFLSVADESAAVEQAHQEAAARISSEPAAEEPRIAAALPSFPLPRVDLRVGHRRRPMLIAAAAAVLAVSTHFALSSNKPRWELGVGVPLPDLGPRTLRAERPATQPTTATVLPASVPAEKGSPSFGGASAFSTPKPEEPAAAPPEPPRDTAERTAAPEVAPPPKIAIAAPKIVAAPSLEGDLKSAAGLVARYEEAHAAARADLDNGLKTAGFANLFATTRLQPGGLRAARASVGTATAYVQRYRRREAEIEQAYRDSFDLLSSRNKWSDGQRRTWETRKVRQEHPEVVKLSSFLLQSLDSLYGLLAAQDAAYQLSDGLITFSDAAASRAYGELRPWLDRRAHAWADPETDEPTTAARILKAMGTAKLPEGGSL